MRNNWIAKAGAAALVIGCGAMASAQSNGPIGLAARIGVFLPTDSSAHDLSSTWFAVGLDYKLNSYVTQMASGLGYFGISADFYNHGANSNVPIDLTYSLRQGQLVYGVGAGVDFYNIPDIGSRSGTGLDLQASIAYDLSTGPVPIFLQAKYFLAGRSELRGFDFYAGIRF